jgi:hypothetical protein
MKRFLCTLPVVLALLASLIPAAQPVAAAPMAAPPSGWVQAQVVGGGCDAQGHCSSTVRPGSPTLYEYKPDRQSVGRDFRSAAINHSTAAIPPMSRATSATSAASTTTGQRASGITAATGR